MEDNVGKKRFAEKLADAASVARIPFSKINQELQHPHGVALDKTLSQYVDAMSRSTSPPDMTDDLVLEHSIAAALLIGNLAQVKLHTTNPRLLVSPSDIVQACDQLQTVLTSLYQNITRRLPDCEQLTAEGISKAMDGVLKNHKLDRGAEVNAG